MSACRKRRRVAPTSSTSDIRRRRLLLLAGVAASRFLAVASSSSSSVSAAAYFPPVKDKNGDVWWNDGGGSSDDGGGEESDDGGEGGGTWKPLVSTDVENLNAIDSANEMVAPQQLKNETRRENSEKSSETSDKAAAGNEEKFVDSQPDPKGNKGLDSEEGALNDGVTKTEHPNISPSEISRPMSKDEVQKEDKASLAHAKKQLSQQSRQQQEDEESQPLQTLQKLQQMLDETDYMTGTKRRTSQKSHLDLRHRSTRADEIRPVGDLEKLWTSKDRKKYKKLQRQQRMKKEEEMMRRETNHPRHPFESAFDAEALSDDSDDGLGYTLPNLPVYYSDAELESEELEDDQSSFSTEPGRMKRSQEGPETARPSSKDAHPPPKKKQDTPDRSSAAVNEAYVQHPPQQLGYRYPQPGIFAPSYLSQYQPLHQQQHQYMTPPPPMPEGYVQPPPPHLQHQYNPYMYPQHPYMYNPYAGYYAQYPGTQQQRPSGPYGSWNPHQQTMIQPPQTQAVPAAVPRPRQVVPPEKPKADTQPQDIKENVGTGTVKAKGIPPSPEDRAAALVPIPPPPPQFVRQFQGYPSLPVEAETEPADTTADDRSNLSFASFNKVGLLLVSVALACYAGVSPRTLPLTEYNLHFYDNLRLVSLATVAPIVEMLSVLDTRVNDINALVNTFFVSFTAGYLLTFFTEVVVTTCLRLGVFLWLERDVFALTPRVPLPVLPWVLRDERYRPKRITLFAADFLTSCVACPIIEEFAKLRLLEWTCKLPRNFKQVTKSATKTKRRRRVAVEVDSPSTGVTTVNKYITQMLAASIGLKLCDAARRILLYTKRENTHKSFYALVRGIFPVHELCGTMTAISLAQRDILGVNMPLWKMLLPAVFIHGMANFRGMKPIFKWNSATPWSELQWSPLSVPDASSLPRLLQKGFAKLMLLIFLSRVLGYCIKNYYMVNRQAVKRTTTYAGKHSAFSAELATAELLKKQKKK